MYIATGFSVQRPEKIGDEILLQLKEVLPESVANNLSSNDGDGSDLSPSDITIIFHDYEPFDVKEKPMEIIILANDFPNRAKYADKRACDIGRDIHEGVSGNFSPADYFVYIHLGKGGFWSWSPKQ